MNKETTYTALLPQIAALIKGESNETSVLANVAAALHQAFEPFFWTGFYLLHPDGMLRLGPFPDVEQFPGHIACSALSRSEIVVPVFSKSGKPVAVLDIDSKQLATFDDTDKHYLEQVAQLLTDTLY